jgi:hypothetical protein
MAKPITEFSLPNGLTIVFIDHSRQYFGDIYRVKLEIVCRVPILEQYFTDPQEFIQAGAILGNTVVYRRMEEQMGVPSSDIEMVLQKLIKNFTDHSLIYFKTDTFPRKIILSEMSKINKRGRGQLSY